uniref:Uncharacterized protein n=1 Tax=Quercus lobata TaxID=97700 RepID=A0A7N2MQT3_QUELO
MNQGGAIVRHRDLRPKQTPGPAPIVQCGDPRPIQALGLVSYWLWPQAQPKGPVVLRHSRGFINNKQENLDSKSQLWKSQRSTVNGQSKSTVNLEVNGQIQIQKVTSADDASSDVSKLLRLTSAMTSARLLMHVRRVTARGRCVKGSCGAWWRVWRVIGVTATLRGAWGRVQSPMVKRLPRICRLALDDLSGAFKNLLVYGDGNVIPNSLKILQPNLQYSVLVNLSSTAQYGRVILVMDKNFCPDSAGNKFERNKNSNFTVRFDRRTMVVNLTTHVPERQLVLDDVNGETRLVLATNNCVKLRICITFLVPVLNSSAEILKSLEPEILYSLPMSQGKLLPLNVSKDDPGHRRFKFMVDGCISGMAIVTVGIDENSITSIHGTPVSKADPITFLFGTVGNGLQVLQGENKSSVCRKL